MVFKKLVWTFKRHPFLYISRFKLLSKNSNSQAINEYYYNQLNTLEDIPSYFSTINDSIFNDGKPSDDIDRVKILTVWLRKHIKGGPGLSEPSEEALKIMLEGKGGVCSDIVQIFNNFCVLNGIKVREWGSTRTPFDQDFGGHSFNEIYSKELKKWVLIDVSSCVLFYNTHTKIPLSVIELYQLVRSKSPLEYDSFYKTKYFSEKSVFNNYLNPKTTPFLICNYSNKTYDKYLKYTRSFLPVFVIHFVLYLLNKSYYYLFPLDDYRKIFLDKI